MEASNGHPRVSDHQEERHSLKQMLETANMNVMYESQDDLLRLLFFSYVFKSREKDVLGRDRGSEKLSSRNSSRSAISKL